jgi:hypothetical protein
MFTQLGSAPNCTAYIRVVIARYEAIQVYLSLFLICCSTPLINLDCFVAKDSSSQ